MSKLRQPSWDVLIRQALHEDVGKADVTTNSLISSQRQSQARVFFKTEGVVAGVDLAANVFRFLDPKMVVTKKVSDGQKIKQGATVFTLKGSTRAILTGERVALNFLSYATAIATQTRAYVEAIKPHKTAIMDTRKTIPTLRMLQRYAVRCGGGVNHRFDLNEMVMIKDNHRVECAPEESLAQTVMRLKKKVSKPIIVEVDTLKELQDVLPARPDVVLLDNFRARRLREAVALIKKMPRARRPLIEASGGITLRSIKNIAATGVDRISIGALTHSLKNMDVSLEIL